MVGRMHAHARAAQQAGWLPPHTAVLVQCWCGCWPGANPPAAWPWPGSACMAGCRNKMPRRRCQCLEQERPGGAWRLCNAFAFARVATPGTHLRTRTHARARPGCSTAQVCTQDNGCRACSRHTGRAAPGVLDGRAAAARDGASVLKDFSTATCAVHGSALFTRAPQQIYSFAAGGCPGAAGAATASGACSDVALTTCRVACSRFRCTSLTAGFLRASSSGRSSPHGPKRAPRVPPRGTPANTRLLPERPPPKQPPPKQQLGHSALLLVQPCRSHQGQAAPAAHPSCRAQARPSPVRPDLVPRKARHSHAPAALQVHRHVARLER